MNKKVLVSISLVVLVAGGFFVVKERPKVEKSNVEGRNEVVEQKIVSQTSELPGSSETRRVDSDVNESDAAVAFSAEELSEPVRMLLGLDGKERNYPELLAAIHRLGYELSDADVAALREMLTYPNDRFPEKMRDIEINAVKNDVLDRLLRQKELSEGLGLQMVEMAENPENDPVWRDYCVQFMEPFYERKSGESVSQASRLPSDEHGRRDGGGTGAELTAIHDAMLSALDERSETIAGTALIGLELLSRSYDEFDREVIVEKAVEIASDEMASSSSRLTAMRLSAQISNNEQGTSNVEVVQTARALAQTGETVLLRSAAIVTLGDVGTGDDRELLESFTFAENKQIAAAAKLALQKMNSRN